MEVYKRIDVAKLKLQQKIKGGFDQNIYTFDIETSSGYLFPGETTARPFDYNLSPQDYRDTVKVGLCYEWQFGINDEYYFGRDLKDFMDVIRILERLPGKKILWVHNLGFEASYLLNLFFPKKIFARSAHHIIYMDYSETLTFRCTFQLTHMSLKSWGKELGIEKIEDYDYDTIRTPKSPLSEFEKNYGQRDLEILTAGIRKMLEIYKTVQKIPNTQTGRVRREGQKLFSKDPSYRFRMARLLPKNAAEYALLREAFCGGNVHTNWYYAGMLLKGVNSCDIASSYPFVCCSEPLPMHPWRKAGNPDYYINNNKFCCLLRVKLKDITSKGHIDYISYSKLYDVAYHMEKYTVMRKGKPVEKEKKVEDITLENGRVYWVKEACATITNIDYDIIKDAYSGEIEILDLWYSRAALLDPRYVNFILDLYENKTALKNIPEKADLYSYSKQLINGIYGDFVSSIVYDETQLLPNGEWKETVKTPIEVNERLDQMREKPWRLKSSFSWGVWITAAARRNHYEILKAMDKKNHVVYYDTDSVYYLGNHDKDIKAYNKRMVDRIDKALKKNGIDPERSRPKDSKGKKRQLGILEIEHKNLPEFKALRAKCYAYKDEQGECHITISGVNKKAGVAALHGSVANLKDDMIFSYEECGKKISQYNVNQPRTRWVDERGVEYISDYKYGLVLQPTQYKLSLTQDFLDVLGLLHGLSSGWSSFTTETLENIIEME